MNRNKIGSLEKAGDRETPIGCSDKILCWAGDGQPFDLMKQSLRGLRIVEEKDALKAAAVAGAAAAIVWWR